MTRLEQRIAQVAEATGKRVVVGRQGHKDEWFAHCDGIECAGSYALAAIESLVVGLKERAEREARVAAVAATKAAQLGAL